MEKGGRKVGKGLKMVLEKRGVLTLGKTSEWMRKTLGEHAEFRDKKSMVETKLLQKGHILCFFVKVPLKVELHLEGMGSKVRW